MELLHGARHQVRAAHHLNRQALRPVEELVAGADDAAREVSSDVHNTRSTCSREGVPHAANDPVEADAADSERDGVEAFPTRVWRLVIHVASGTSVWIQGLIRSDSLPVRTREESAGITTVVVGDSIRAGPAIGSPDASAWWE